MRAIGLEQMWQAGLSHQKRPARVDISHQVITFEVRFWRRGQTDRTRVIDDRINTAEFSDRLINCSVYLILLANVVGWGLSVLAAITTLAPAPPHALAIASPIPRLPPEINTVLPVNAFMMVLRYNPS